MLMSISRLSLETSPFQRYCVLDLEANFHSGGSEWKDPNLEALLQQRMPKTYSSYMDTMESMLETIKGLEVSLGTDKTHFQSHVSIKGEYVSQLFTVSNVMSSLRILS
jgi:hypothetical protein